MKKIKKQNKYLVGSTYFFNSYSDFKSKDIDYLEIELFPLGYMDKLQITGQGQCIFKWRKMSADSYVANSLKSDLAMEIGKFLIPEFCKEVNFTIEHLKKLEPLLSRLDDKHKYEKVIFDAYIENNDFYLTDEQRLKAYEEYKKYRKE